MNQEKIDRMFQLIDRVEKASFKTKTFAQRVNMASTQQQQIRFMIDLLKVMAATMAEYKIAEEYISTALYSNGAFVEEDLDKDSQEQLDKAKSWWNEVLKEE